MKFDVDSRDSYSPEPDIYYPKHECKCGKIHRSAESERGCHEYSDEPHFETDSKPTSLRFKDHDATIGGSTAKSQHDFY